MENVIPTSIMFGGTTKDLREWFYSINPKLYFEMSSIERLTFNYVGAQLEFAGQLEGEFVDVLNALHINERRVSYKVKQGDEEHYFDNAKQVQAHFNCSIQSLYKAIECGDLNITVERVNQSIFTDINGNVVGFKFRKVPKY